MFSLINALCIVYCRKYEKVKKISNKRLNSIFQTKKKSMKMFIFLMLLDIIIITEIITNVLQEFPNATSNNIIYC
jgi:hypothetical protein